jgi:NitT/TauT family transport system substrate-binding protein
MSLPFPLVPVVHAAVRLILVALVLAARPVAAESLSLAVSRSPLSLPLYVAQSEGYFAEEGLDVQLKPCVGGYRCMRQVLEGQADFATVGDVPIALSAFSSSDWAIVATFVTTHDDVKLVARKGVVASAAQLAGKRIGVVSATASHYFLESYLLTHFIDPLDVQAVALQPEELVPALTEGRVDAIAAWEPYAYSAVQALKGGAQALSGGGYRATFNLVVQRRLVGARDASIVRVLRALERAQVLIREQPARAHAVLRRTLAVDQAFVDYIWPQLQYRLSLDQGLLKTLESEARWALRERHVVAARPPNFLGVLYPAPLLIVKPDSTGIVR